MSLRSWRFVTLLLAALAMGMKLAHALELPAKRQLDPNMYLVVQTRLYGLFGTIGPILELGALLFVAVLAVRVRGRPAFLYTLISTCMIVLSLCVWAVFVRSASQQIAYWDGSQAIPADWTRWRDQWQYGQAATFLLHLVGLSALIRSVLVETPETENSRAVAHASKLNTVEDGNTG